MSRKRKKTNKRKARGILKRTSKYSTDKKSKDLRSNRVSRPAKEYSNDESVRDKRVETLRKKIDTEYTKNSPNMEKIYDLSIKIDSIYKERRGTFQSTYPVSSKDFMHPGENYPASSRNQRKIYRKSVVDEQERRRVPSKDPTRLRWGPVEVEPRQPSPVNIVAATFIPPQPRTWGQFALQTLGFRTGTGTKKRKKKSKSKSKSKSRS